MKSFLFTALILLSMMANASSYYCITSPEVPNKFYEYEDGDDDATLYEMKLNQDALDFVEHHPREHSFNRNTEVTILGEVSFIKNPNRHERIFWVVENGQTTLQVTEPRKRLVDPKKVKKNKNGSPLIFAGQVVKKVYFVLCGED